MEEGTMRGKAAMKKTQNEPASHKDSDAEPQDAKQAHEKQPRDRSEEDAVARAVLEALRTLD